MDSPATRAYERIKANVAKYYETHKDEVLERKRAKYKEDNPNPRPRGRPKKSVAGGSIQVVEIPI